MGAIGDKIKGKAKQIRGRLTGDNVLEAQGTVEKARGNLEGVMSRFVRNARYTLVRVKTRAKAGLARIDRGPRAG